MPREAAARSLELEWPWCLRCPHTTSKPHRRRIKYQHHRKTDAHKQKSGTALPTDECPLLMFLISSTSKMDTVTAAVPGVRLGLSKASATE